MENARFECVVNAPFDILWEVIKDEIENPHLYNPGIKGVKILERFNGGVLRSVAVPDADVREKIIFDHSKKVINSQLVGHQQLFGVIRKTISAQNASDNAYTLSCTVEWEATDDRVFGMVRRNIEGFIMNGLNKVKAKAEQLSQTAD